MSYNNVSKVWTPESFPDYLATIKKPSWATRICLHHTFSPNLAQRPNGFTIQHIENMKSFYQGLGWNRGPQLFVDDDQIFGITPLTERGIHAPSYNSNAIGIEVLGDYDNEDPKSGRGENCWITAFQTVRALRDWLGIPIDDEHIVFHRECKITQRTSRKSCPGTKIQKDWVLEGIRNYNPVTSKIFKERVYLNPITEAKNFVPLAATLKSRGFSDQQIKKNLRREGKNFFWLDEHLEFAYYDKQTKTTMAPLEELENIKL